NFVANFVERIPENASCFDKFSDKVSRLRVLGQALGSAAPRKTARGGSFVPSHSGNRMAHRSSDSGRCPKRRNSASRVASEEHSMKWNVRNCYGVGQVGLIACSMLCGFRARALEPETLFNFQLSLGTVMGSLVQGPDGNFYGTTADGGTLAKGTVFRVTP